MRIKSFFQRLMGVIGLILVFSGTLLRAEECVLIDARLRWAPPALTEPTPVHVSPQPWSIKLDPGQDYVLYMPDEPVTKPIAIIGGRNVVLIGGEIRIPLQPDLDPSIASRRGLKIVDATGIVHIEGLLIHGDDLTEGIQIAAPLADIRLQNIRVGPLHARDEVNFTDNHPDVIQPYGGFAHLRVDRLTGITNYQGIFLKCSSNCPFGETSLTRINLTGLSTARFLFWVDPARDAGAVTLDQVWVDVPPERAGGLGNAVWPHSAAPTVERASIHQAADGQVYAMWDRLTTPRIIGRIFEGQPITGDFVPEGVAGWNYRSPGYLDCN